MKQLFVVRRSRGPSWDNTRPLEGQQDWPAHASFMDTLYAEGFVLLAGPLEEKRAALVIIRADDANQVRSRLADDPWTRNDLLRTDEITPWTLRLGSL